MANDDKHRGYHDLGGHDGGPIDKSEHVLEPWEKRVDAIRGLLGDKKRRVMRADGLRSAIETMGEELYTELSYYEKWMAAIMKITTDRGILTHDEIDQRMDEIIARLGLGELESRPTPPRSNSAD